VQLDLAVFAGDLKCVARIFGVVRRSFKLAEKPPLQLAAAGRRSR
jgi:hypothetical protein